MSRQIVYVQGMGEAFAEEMARDERVFVMGIDVQRSVFGHTAGLVNHFGAERVRNTPICESGIVGTALGASLAGMRPCAEVMFSDFALIAADQIANQVASWHYMTGGQWQTPLVIYTFDGAGMGLGYNHSQCTENMFQSIPGLIIVVPSDAYMAKGLLKAAIRSNNPVLYFAHKALLGMPGEVPDEDYTVPLTQARVVREGSDVTVVAHHLMLHHALGVANVLAEEGVSVEVIDPVCIAPLDKETILKSVRKTGKLVTVEECRKVGGVGSEIAATVTEEAFYDLDAPIKRVGGPSIPIPGSSALEQSYVPGPDQIREAITSIL